MYSLKTISKDEKDAKVQNILLNVLKIKKDKNPYEKK